MTALRIGVKVAELHLVDGNFQNAKQLSTVDVKKLGASLTDTKSNVGGREKQRSDGTYRETARVFIVTIGC
jgi:hypothetical protein